MRTFIGGQPKQKHHHGADGYGYYSDTTPEPPRHQVAVVLVCHGEYLKYLPDALRSIDRQTAPAGEKFLLLDGCDVPPGLVDAGWRVIRGRWGNPNPARNAGLRLARSKWVVFFDADNVMPSDYISQVNKRTYAAGHGLALFYPDIQYCDEQMRPTRRLEVPAFDPWHARECTAYDTSSAWNRYALLSIGGWDEQARAWDDFRLVLKLAARNWRCEKLGSTVFMREHKTGVRRSMVDVQTHKDESFQFFTLTILTLLSGRVDVLDDLRRTLLTLEIPRTTFLTLVDNSGQQAFNDRLAAMLPRLLKRFAGVHIMRLGQPYKIVPGEPYLQEERHEHVARLYAQVLPGVNTDRLLLLEDDVVPPTNGLRQLSDELFTNNLTGAVAGLYRSASHPDHACAAMENEQWYGVPRFDDVPGHAIPCGFFGGGFTLYSVAALKKTLPIVLTKEGQYLMGWDGHTCRAMRRAGYKLLLHGGVRCEHNYVGATVETYEQKNEIGY